MLAFDGNLRSGFYGTLRSEHPETAPLYPIYDRVGLKRGTPKISLHQYLLLSTSRSFTEPLRLTRIDSEKGCAWVASLVLGIALLHNSILLPEATLSTWAYHRTEFFDVTTPL